mgnify:CR=1 FL=1
MSLVRYEPLFSVRQLQDDINRLFSGWSTNDSSGVTADWVPSVDINEFDDKFQLFVDVPGVDPKDVEITLEAGVLTISGERYMQAEKADENIVRRRNERGSGTVTVKSKPEKQIKQVDNILKKLGNKWDKILKGMGK